MVLLYQNKHKQPCDTEKLLAKYPVDDCYHISVDQQEDIPKLVRIITGTSLGLVLSGGGARGFAHIGLIQALHELGVNVDMIGGTSAGALISCAYAMGYSVEEMKDLCKQFSLRATSNDYTFPYMSLMSGKNLNQVLKDIFGNDSRIEDLWLRCFCVSTNISNCDIVIHQTGKIWESVRASISLPGIYPPVITEQGLLVDGGVINNLPINIMNQQFYAGKVLASNIEVSSDHLYYDASINDESGWDIFLSTINPFKKNKKNYPRVSEILRRSISVNELRHQAKIVKSADYYVGLDLSDYDMIDFSQYEDIIACGYEQAKKKLSKMKI